MFRKHDSMYAAQASGRTKIEHLRSSVDPIEFHIETSELNIDEI